MERYRMKAVLFDTMADCRNLKERLLYAGILYTEILFEPNEEQSLRKAVEELGVSLTECLLITNNQHHARIAEQFSLVCAGCVEGLYELPKTAALLETPDEVSPDYLEMVYCHEKGVPAVVMETERCYLRELTSSDADALYEIFSNPEVQRYLQEKTGTKEEEEEKLSAYINTAYPFFGYGFWGVFCKESGVLIGKAGFQEGSMPLEAGYVLKPSVWGRGLATEVLAALLNYAKEELDVSDVIVKIREGNAASLRVAEKCGMHEVAGKEESPDRLLCLSF